MLALVLTLALAQTEDLPIAKGTAAPFTGILVSNDTYAGFIKTAAELNKLKATQSAEKELYAFKEQQLNELLKLKQGEADAWKKQAEKNAARSWWDDNKLQVGIVLGVAATVAVVYAVKQLP